MAKTVPRQGHATMRPRARLIGLIGDELISDEPVALVELVKNSYDADATKVEVRFEGKDPVKPDRIVVTDDGIGMDLDTVLEAWFEPGTVMKRKCEQSPHGRSYQGAKGIGRFATARLAKSLLLESKTENALRGACVLLEWGQFDDDSYLDEISVDYQEMHLKSMEHGTRLTLDCLRKTWEEDDYKHLYARLSRLISPFDDVTDFDIHLEIPAFPQLSGRIEPPELILQPKYLLRGKLDKQGYFSGELRLDGKKRETFKNRKLDDKNVTPRCGPFEVEIRGWDRDPKGLEPIGERLNMGIQDIRRTLDTYCGVSIYRDGFRVHPYGQKGNDWLNLDIRSRLTPGLKMANNQIVAAIRISREENPKLSDRSTREGMVLNAEHTALEKWFKEILTLLEEKRYDIRPRRKTDDQIEPLFEAFDVSPAVQQARKELGKDHPLATLIADTEKQVKEGVERVQEVFSRLLMSAGLGHMIDIVIHEIGAPLGKINRQLAVMEKQLTQLLEDRGWAKVEPMIQSIKSWLEQIHNLRQRLDPQTPAKRGRATSFDVKQEINDNFELHQALLKKQGISWRIAAPREPVQVRMSRAALGQIIVNLIDNSIFWIVREKGIGNGGKILVRLRPLKTGFRIVFCDDGPGVDEADESKIFEPYYSKKPNGIGLGLYIARLVIEPYGKLVYRPDGELQGACFEAVFERRVGG